MVEAITASPRRPVRIPVMRQLWADAVFIHWETEPVAARAWLPPGVDLDRHAGRAYVGLVGLRIEVALFGLVPVPFLGSFTEVNVRLYSVDRQGRRGIVFCSLDAGRLLPAIVGRAGLGLPYSWAEAASDRHGQTVTYRVARRWPGAAHPKSSFVVRIGDRLPRPSPLEAFLTTRWTMHWSAVGLTWWSAAEHQPWELHSAELESVDDELVQAAGLSSCSTGPVSVLWSRGVRALIGPPRPLGSRLQRSHHAPGKRVGRCSRACRSGWPRLG